MDVFWIRVVSQLGIYGVFTLYLLWTVRRGPSCWAPFLGTVLYAIVFEHFNMLRYAHVVGGYHYHPRSWLFLWGDVPLYIPLAWAFVVSTSQSLSDRIVREAWRKPFSDALQALLLDLSLDIVAIRLGFWTWRGIRWSDAFFGVPADNFLGWLLVTFTFTALTRRLWKSALRDRADLALRSAIQFVIVPIAAYLLYLGLEGIVHSLYYLVHASSQRGQLAVLAGVLLLFVLIAYTRNRRIGRPQTAGRPSPPSVPAPEMHSGEDRLDRWALHGPRQVFHLFGIIGLICIPAARWHPALLTITLVVWAIEAALWHSSAHGSPS